MVKHNKNLKEIFMGSLKVISIIIGVICGGATILSYCLRGFAPYKEYFTTVQKVELMPEGNVKVITYFEDQVSYIYCDVKDVKIEACKERDNIQIKQLEADYIEQINLNCNN